MKGDTKQRVWPDVAARVLSEELNRPITERTLTNWRYQRKGPKPEYFGQRPAYTLGELRRYVREEAFRPQPAERRMYRTQHRRRRQPGETVTVTA
jgi:hypothetical protein